VFHFRNVTLVKMIITFTLNGIAYRDGGRAGDIVRLPQSGKKRVGTVRKVTSYISSRRFFFPRGANGQQKKKKKKKKKKRIYQWLGL
jgi:hypothetical protein